MDKKNIAIIGCGNMGGAIATALSKKDEFSVYIHDKDKACMDRLNNGKMSPLDTLENAKDMDVVLIAIKPQVLPTLYNELSKLNPKMFISIAAGVSIKMLEYGLGKKAPIVRFMPNIAAKTGSSVTAVATSSQAKDSDKALALDIASSFGSAFELEEKLFPAFIGISGSAIAYVFEFMHQLAMGGVREGIPYKNALSIVRDTLISATSLQKESQMGAIELETMVCSAAGTTIEGIKALDDGAFGKTVIDAVSAAANKSRDLEKNA